MVTIAAGETILASDIQAIKDVTDALLAASVATVATEENTSSTSYTDLATSGPSVTLTTGTVALVLFSASLINSTANARAIMSVEVSGATSISAADSWSLAYRMTDTVTGTTNKSRLPMFQLFSSLTAGSNTFTCKYRAASGTATFQNRSIVVIPLSA